MTTEQEQTEATDSVDRVEEALLGAIAEAAANVESAGEEAPSALDSANAERATSAANVATGWTNVAVGLIAGLERFRLAHDKVKGGGQVSAGVPGGLSDEDVRIRALMAKVKAEAENGASPTWIARLIAESGLFVTAEG